MKRIGYVLCRVIEAWPDNRLITTYYADTYWTNHLDQAKVFPSFGDVDVKLPMGDNLVCVFPMQVRENRAVVEERLYHK